MGPASVTGVGASAVSILMEAVPLALPVADGANCAVKVVFCPAASVSGRDKPLMLNPVPEALAAERVTLAVPEVVKLEEHNPVLPTRTHPKIPLLVLKKKRTPTPVPR